MTHNELLARLDLYEADYFDFPNKELLALRAVVELHKPYPDEYNWCSVCSDPIEGVIRPYPCPTIQVIEKELA